MLAELIRLLSDPNTSFKTINGEIYLDASQLG
jgi:hypothetical protein